MSTHRLFTYIRNTVGLINNWKMLLPNLKPQLTHMLSHERLVHNYTTHDLPHGQIMQKFVVKFVILALNNNKKT